MFIDKAQVTRRYIDMELIFVATSDHLGWMRLKQESTTQLDRHIERTNGRLDTLRLNALARSHKIPLASHPHRGAPASSGKGIHHNMIA